MNKLLISTLAAAASAVVLAQPVLSQTDNIVVTSGSIDEAAFVAKVSQDLDRQLRSASFFDDHAGEGITSVRFTRDENGEPADVTLHRASGTRSLDRIAMRAVSRLRSLDVVPRTVGADQVYQANIIFAGTESSYRKLNNRLAAEETARIAAGTDKVPVLAFGSASSQPQS